MSSLPDAPSLNAESIGRAVREAEAALCRIHHAASVLLTPHLAFRAAEPLHTLGLARAASVGLVDDSEPFYLASPARADGPESVAVPWLPRHTRDATPEHWARLGADVEVADNLLAGLARAFYRHCHAAERWSDVSRALDLFWGGALAARVANPAGAPGVRPTNAGRRGPGRYALERLKLV